MSRSSVVWLPSVSVSVRNTPFCTASALVLPNKRAAGLPVHQCPLPSGVARFSWFCTIFELRAERAAVGNGQQGAGGQA